MFTTDCLLESVCVEHYFRLNRQIRCAETRRQYLYALKDFDRSLGHAATIGDLNDDNVSLMMGALDEAGLAERTINERRGRIHALWSWLCKRGELSVWPTTAKIPEPQRSPLAWREEELRALMNAAATLRGNYDGVPRWLWWTCLLSTMWNSGERIGALLAIRWEHLDFDGRWLHVPAEIRKGRRKDMTYRLSPDTIASLRLLRRYGTSEVFHWPRHPSYLWEAFGRVIKAAGLPGVARQKFHRMRRSFASHGKRAGMDVQSVMGHSTEATTAKYLDPRLVRTDNACDLLPDITRAG